MSDIEEGEPGAAAAPGGGRQRRRVVLSIVAVVVLVGGFFVVRDLWWGLRPTPSFPSLATDPDPALVGTVAFQSPYPDDSCVSVVPAAGGAPHRVTCVDGFQGGGTLQWLPDGRLRYTQYQDPAKEQQPTSVLIDVATGETTPVRPEDVPPRPAEDAQGPNGEVIETSSSAGTLTIDLTVGGRTRRLLSVGAPYTYTVQGPAWGPDGAYVVLQDDLDRLVLVTTGEPASTRVLAEQAWGHAVTERQLDDLLAVE